MPQNSRLILPQILNKISVLYQIEEIDKEAKDKMCALAKSGITNNFEELYHYISCIENKHDILEDILDIILFQ